MSISKELYWKRRNNHLCTRCGKIAEYNKTLCPYHLQKANKNQQAMIVRRKNKGLCPSCGQKLENNRKICNNCLEKNAPHHKRADTRIPWTDRKKLGLCMGCGEQNSTKNLYCSKCSGKHQIRKTLIYKQRIANGLCGHCGQRLLAKNKKRCIICIYKHNKWYSTSITRTKNIDENRLVKNQVVDNYGGKCNCCGETERTFLAIDHINGGGNIHRKRIKKLSSISFYRWLINEKFPDDFQILCHNCNMSKYLLGECAHNKGNNL